MHLPGNFVGKADEQTGFTALFSDDFLTLFAETDGICRVIGGEVVNLRLLIGRQIFPVEPDKFFHLIGNDPDHGGIAQTELSSPAVGIGTPFAVGVQTEILRIACKVSGRRQIFVVVVAEVGAGRPAHLITQIERFVEKRRSGSVEAVAQGVEPELFIALSGTVIPEKVGVTVEDLSSGNGGSAGLIEQRQSFAGKVGVNALIPGDEPDPGAAQIGVSAVESTDGGSTGDELVFALTFQLPRFDVSSGAGTFQIDRRGRGIFGIGDADTGNFALLQSLQKFFRRHFFVMVRIFRQYDIQREKRKYQGGKEEDK